MKHSSIESETGLLKLIFTGIKVTVAQSTNGEYHRCVRGVAHVVLSFCIETFWCGSFPHTIPKPVVTEPLTAPI